jgi:hypothetical protein
MIITPQQFKDAFSKLPYILREYISGEKMDVAVVEVGNAHQLHVDTIGAIQREVTNMLLGLLSPEQFVGELRSIGIPTEQIAPITEELNKKIFMPIREKMLHPEDDDDEETEEESEVPIPTPQPAYTAPAAAPTVTPAAAPTTPFTPTPAAEQPAQPAAMPVQPIAEAVHVPQAPIRATAPAQTAPAKQTDNREALQSVLKKYGIDPYREPAE